MRVDCNSTNKPVKEDTFDKHRLACEKLKYMNKNGNMICWSVKAELGLFEGQLRGVVL